MANLNHFKKALLLTIVSGAISLAPKLSLATEVQTYVNGELTSSEDSQDSYLKDLVDNLKTVELSPEYQKALSELKKSTSACSSLDTWSKSKPDLSANFIVKKYMTANQGTPTGPTYSITLNYPEVRSDTFNIPIQVFSNPSLLTQVSLAKFFKKILQRVEDASFTNRNVCSRLVNDDMDKKDAQKISSNKQPNSLQGADAADVE